MSRYSTSATPMRGEEPTWRNGRDIARILRELGWNAMATFVEHMANSNQAANQRYDELLAQYQKLVPPITHEPSPGYRSDCE
jgi:hypothetical protein